MLSCLILLHSNKINSPVFFNISSIQEMVTARTIDLRSDTVTKPTESMRLAMSKAEVDDDVLIYDPTARQLENEMARITGKEAALFVPSGTMGNLISVLVHCEIRGSEVILGNNSHIHIYENGGISTIGGVHPRPVMNNDDGTMDIDLIQSAIRNPNFEICYPKTRLICLENSHANTGGRCLSVQYTDRVGEIVKKHGLKLHIDGARIFNAAVALGVPVHRLVQAADSVSVCLSKGLGAPVGSVIVGTKTFIDRARILRKTLGGGMRQVGILCAAALVALQENVQKLAIDHNNAKTLAEGLNKIKGLSVNLTTVETNIVYFEILEGSHITALKLGKIMEDHGILLMPDSSSRVRIVVHHQVSASDVQYTLSCIKQAMTGVADENGDK
ncbi:low-specificity L-threonine aldolase 1-like isoform X2 [Rutidosis leptorrhynchoides]|uniref:low-specificity L-threonine aldolase 1-like isoform X2 n=1 Tax=Rutidosis leptorrhynchoides TaxID=125765 RepID=UPI003A99F929